MNEQHKKKQTVLVVDDVPEYIDILAAILKKDYRVKFAINGEKTLAIAREKDPPDLILLDVEMPDMDGYEVCRQLKQQEDTRKIPVIFVTAHQESEAEEKGFDIGGVDYITKPVNPSIVKARVRTQLALYDQNRVLDEMVQLRTGQLKKALEDIKGASLNTIHRLSKAAEFKDEDTGSHILRMSNYAAVVARKMGLDEETVEGILYAAPMHDVGKIGTPDRILLKPGKLDPDEWVIMKQHVTNGVKILETTESGFLKMAETIALTHHERWDGSGYPNGLKGEEIDIAGRIVAIADVFDALTSRRPYKEPFSFEKSFGIIEESRDSHFDPQVVDAFFSVTDKILAIKKRHKDNDESVLFKLVGVGNNLE